MSRVPFKGTSADIAGELLAIGRKAPDFKLTAGDLSDVSLADFRGKVKILNIVPLSTFRSPAFGKDHGVRIAAGALAGLMSRAVVVLDVQDKVIHAEQVPEIAQEPDYAAALNALPPE
jgi:thiol peroxidase